MTERCDNYRPPQSRRNCRCVFCRPWYDISSGIGEYPAFSVVLGGVFLDDEAYLARDEDREFILRENELVEARVKRERLESKAGREDHDAKDSVEAVAYRNVVARRMHDVQNGG